jgi:UDP-MurNAc hydroxylase
MNVQLVSHASVIIESNSTVIWTDPWLFGKAFNNSWALVPPPEPVGEALLDKITHVWISHEHPDHFHIPTLRSLPASFKERVTVLYQKLNSEKMIAAFKRLGFKNIELLPHRKTMELPDGTKLYSYYVGVMDSCLAVKDGQHTLLDANDAQIESTDCATIRKDIGKVDTLLTQFSIAFYSGLPDYEERLTRMAQGILRRIAGNHRDLGVERTIPFASFIYYSSEENRYINRFHNTPGTVYEYFKSRNQPVVVLYPGDVFNDSESHDSSAALRRFEELDMDKLPYDVPEEVPFDKIQEAFLTFCEGLHKQYPSLVLKLLKPLVVNIPDLQRVVVLSIGRRTFNQTDFSRVCDLSVNSQALHFCFANPFGFQTLGVSGRAKLSKDSTNWRMHHLLFVLNNAEISLRPKYLLSRKTIEFIRQRSSGGLNLLSYVASRMRRVSPLESSE